MLLAQLPGTAATAVIPVPAVNAPEPPAATLPVLPAATLPELVAKADEQQEQEQQHHEDNPLAPVMLRSRARVEVRGTSLLEPRPSCSIRADEP